MLANSITISRIILSLILLFIAKKSDLFIIIYMLCGISDVLDGFVSRILHTESEIGAMIDSLADLVFAIVYILKILPIFSLVAYEYIWIIAIAIAKIILISFKSKKRKTFYIEHSFLNKFTGALLFILPLTINFINIRYSVLIVCIVASITIFDEINKLISYVNI